MEGSERIFGIERGRMAERGVVAWSRKSVAWDFFGIEESRASKTVCLVFPYLEFRSIGSQNRMAERLVPRSIGSG
jgi:hypothetical protein